MNSTESRPRVVLVNRSVVLGLDHKLLLVQRAKDDSYKPDWWEFPGGKLDEGQDISDALEREVLEETGLLIMPEKRIAYFESKIISAGKYAGLPYIVLIGISKVSGGEVMLSEEHQAFAWVTPAEALKYQITEETRKALLTLDIK